MKSLTVIVSTYNQPRYLSLVLEGLSGQTDKDFDCIVADDGSTDETFQVVEKHANHLALVHSWQRDEGFRLAASRNRAFAAASGALIAFLDGDCIPSPEYVEDCKNLMRRARNRVYVQGHRVILDQAVSTALTTDSVMTPEIFQLDWIIKNRRHLSNITNALSYPWPVVKSQSLKGVRGCSMIFHANDLAAINGFDEEFKGWGHEDKDLVSRLYASGVSRVDARGRAIVYHLYHAEQARAAESDNLRRALSDRPAVAKQGISKVV